MKSTNDTVSKLARKALRAATQSDGEAYADKARSLTTDDKELKALADRLIEAIQREAASLDDLTRASGGGRYAFRSADGFTMSIIAHYGAHCSPRPSLGDTNFVPYDTVEVGFPSSRPEPWEEWEQYAEDPSLPCETVYSYVPVATVRDLIELHS